MTVAKRKLWFAVRDRRLDGFKFRRQVSVGPFIADFVCVEAKLVIEVDGGQHTPERDVFRTATIEGFGYEVIRFWNNEVADHFDAVLTILPDRLRARALTQPSPRGRGL